MKTKELKKDLELLERLSKHDLDDWSKKFLRHVITHQIKTFGKEKAFDTLFKFINAHTGTEIIKYNQALQAELDYLKKRVKELEEVEKAWAKSLPEK